MRRWLINFQLTRRRGTAWWSAGLGLAVVLIALAGRHSSLVAAESSETDAVTEAGEGEADGDAETSDADGDDAESDADSADNEEPTPPRQVLLVNTDSDVEEQLTKAREQIAAGEYDKAVQLLQSLIETDHRSLLGDIDEPQRYRSVRSVAEQTLATMPNDARQMYRKRYAATAEQLLRKADDSKDAALLERVARSYGLTDAGHSAIRQLADRAFDRGTFLEAVAQLERLLLLDPGLEPTARATLMAKAAVACHLSGAAQQAEAWAQRLETSHATTRITIAGEPTVAVVFVRRALQAEPRLQRVAPTLDRNWPGPTGDAEGRGVMPPCDLSPLAIWSTPAKERDSRVRSFFGLHPDVRISFEGGWTAAQRDTGGGSARAVALPAIAVPIAADGRVMVRTAQGIEARQVRSGAVVWRCDKFPLYHGDEPRAGNALSIVAGDMGRASISMGGGKVFAIGRFRRIDPATFGQHSADTALNRSSLAAIDPARDGEIAWEVGRGKGSDELLQRGKYLTSPTYHAGRLYTLVIDANVYHAVCLSAEDGKLIWSTPIGPVPASFDEATTWQIAQTVEVLSERGTPPAVAGGLVYFATNLGLVSALDAATGEACWAYRYDSTIIGEASQKQLPPLAHHAFYLPTLTACLPPAGRLLVHRERVLVLPSDGSAVMALDARRGALLWEAERNDAAWLAVLADGRVLTAGKSLRILQPSDGRTLKTLSIEARGPLAVTPDEIIVPSKGRIGRVAIESMKLEWEEVADDVALGALLSHDGRLVAASAAGVTTFGGFDEAWARLQKQTDAAKNKAAQLTLSIEQARLALRANRLAQAADALARATELRGHGDDDALGRLDQIAFTLAMRQAVAKEGDQAAQRHLDHAAKLATTDAQRARVSEQRIAHHAALKAYVEATEQAQRLIDDFGRTWLGEAGDDRQPWPTGRRVGEAWIERLIADHGQQVYASLDERFNKQISDAAKRGDADGIVNATNRYRFAKGRTEALWEAARLLDETKYKDEAVGAALQARVQRICREIVVTGDDKLADKARFRLAMLDAQRHPSRIEALHPSSKFDADQQKAIDTARTSAIRRGVESESEAVDPFRTLTVNLHPQWRMTEGNPFILRDGEGLAIRLGSAVFAISDGRVVRLELSARKAGDASRWVAELPENIGVGTFTNAYRYQVTAPPAPDAGRLVGHLSRDGKTLAIAGTRMLIGLSTIDGRRRYALPLHEIDANAWRLAWSDGDALVLARSRGQAVAIDIARGKRMWDESFHVREWHASAQRGGWLIPDAHDREVRCYDLRTGSRVIERRLREEISACLSSDGFMLLSQPGGKVEIYDPRTRERVAAGKRDTGAAQPLHWLDAGRRHALVARDRGFGVIELSTLAKVTPVDIAVGRRLASVWLVGNQIYAITGAGQDGRTQWRWPVVDEPVLGCWDASTGKQRWKRPLAPGSDGLCHVGPPALRGMSLGVTVTPANRSFASRWWVIEAASGEATDCNGLLSPRVESSDAPRRSPRSAGTPVIGNGHVVIEDEAGLVLLRSDL